MTIFTESVVESVGERRYQPKLVPWNSRLPTRRVPVDFTHAPPSSPCLARRSNFLRDLARWSWLDPRVKPARNA